MPLFWANIAGFLVGLAGSLVGKILLALGIGAVSYTGVSVVLATLRTYLTVSGSALGEYYWVIETLQIPHAIEIMLSAVTFKWTMAGLSPNGAIWRWSFKAPSKQGALF